MKTILLYTTIIGMLAAVAQAQDETVAWQTPVAISGASDVSTQGTFFGSWAPYDGDANTLPVNGVVFEGNSSLPGFSATFPQNDQSGYNAYNSPGNPNANYNTLLQTAAYAGSGNGTIVITWGDTPGHTYLIQAWANDGRGNGRTETFTGGANTSASLDFGDAPGEYITGTYVADGSGSETITLTGSSPSQGNDPQINLLQIRDITATTVTNYQSSVLADNPMGYWPLDLTDPNAADGIATDLSGNTNNGTYENITLSGNLVAGPAPYITNAVNFNGSGYVYLGDGNNPTNLNFTGPTTLEAWVQLASLTPSSLGDIIAKGYDANNNYQEIALRQDTSGNPYYGYFGTGGLSGGQQNTDWVYLVLANDGSNDYLYINGVLVASAPDTTGSISFSNPNIVPWAIGNGTLDGNGRVFFGNICQVAIYNYGLTAAQVMAHYYEAELNASPATSRPIIVSQPQPQAGFIGGPATFSVSVLSGLPTTNQWFEGNTPLAGQTNSTLTLTNLQLSEAGSYSVVVGNANGTTNSVAAILTVASPATLLWGTNDNNGTWDVDTSANWINLSNDTQTVFAQGDAVLFNDTVGEPTSVTVSGTVDPSLIMVNSSTNDFNISSGTISGAGSLVKEGTSTLTLTSAGNFTGSATISGGVLYAGNNSFGSVSSIAITNNSTLDIGGGALGGYKPVTVSGTGYNGEGAIFNSYEDYPVNQLDITLAGDTTFGCTARWDLGSGSQIAGPYYLTIDWNDTSNPYGEWTTVTIGSTVAGITIAPGSKLGTHNMDSSFQNPSTVVTLSTNSQLIFWNGGWNGSIHVDNGAQVYLWSGPSTIDGSNIILESNAQWETYSGSGDEPIDSAVTLNGVAHFLLGDYNRIYTNVFSGIGGFVMDGWNHSMELSASNTYSGPTIIGSDGNAPDVALTGNGSISRSSLIFFGGSNPDVLHIDVSGRTDDTLTLAGGQTLAGVGGINGNLVVSSDATVSPSGTNITIGIDTTSTNAVGALAASGNVTLDGTTVLKLDGSGSNDMVQAGGNMVYGGTLNLVNISGSPLAAGNSFQIFSAANYSGSFGNITPSTPGPGLAWNTSNLAVNGTLTVASMPSQPRITSVALSGTTLTITATNGPVNTAYVLLESTNVALALTNWTPVLTNSFNGSGDINLSTNVINSSNPQEYYILQTQ